MDSCKRTSSTSSKEASSPSASGSLDAYITIVPSGLEDVAVIPSIRQYLQEEHNYQCQDICQLSPPIFQDNFSAVHSAGCVSSSRSQTENETGSGGLESSDSGSGSYAYEYAKEQIVALRRKKSEKKERAKKIKEEKSMKKKNGGDSDRDSSSGDSSRKRKLNSIGAISKNGTSDKNENQDRRHQIQNQDLFENIAPPISLLDRIYEKHIFGTAKLDNGREVNIGFHSHHVDDIDDAAEGSKHEGNGNGSSKTTIVSAPGGLEGKSIIQFRTDAPPNIVANLRAMGCGPLLALVTSSCTPAYDRPKVATHPKSHSNRENESNDKRDDDGVILSYQQTLEEARDAIASFLRGPNDDLTNSDARGRAQMSDYHEQFHQALELWSRHAEYVWFESNDALAYLSSTENGKKVEEEGIEGALKSEGVADNRFDASHVNTHCSEGASDIAKEMDLTTPTIGCGGHEKEAAMKTNQHSQLQKWLLKDLDRKREGVSECKYRLSCIRSYTKDYQYKRDDLIPRLAKVLLPLDGSNALKSKARTGEDSDIDEDMKLEVGNNNERSTNSQQWRFKVDLKHYDFEVLMIMHQNTVTVAIPLNYYQYVGARSYCSGKIPPDITPPYIIGEISKTVIRLRPSISSLLYSMSGIKKGDIIMDPCAGVGTILAEGSFRDTFAIGGDLALAAGLDGSPGLEHIVHRYLRAARRELVHRNQNAASNVGVGAAEIQAWDASLLPIRDSTIDCIISDLPFGQKCMSTKKLQAFLPLLISECARCLRPGTGRMTLLCGSYQGVLEAISLSTVTRKSFHGECQAEECFFDVPTSIIPVNIGGFAAWIIQIKRKSIAHTAFPNHRRIVAKMARKRLQQTKGGGGKRVQA